MSTRRSRSSVAGSTLTLSFLPTTYPSIKTTPDTSSAPKYSKSTLPTLQLSTGYAFSDFISSDHVGKVQPILSFYTSIDNYSFSQSVSGPAVSWSSTTIFTGYPTLLSGTSTFPPSTASSSSTLKAETSGRWGFQCLGLLQWPHWFSLA